MLPHLLEIEITNKLNSITYKPEIGYLAVKLAPFGTGEFTDTCCQTPHLLNSEALDCHDATIKGMIAYNEIMDQLWIDVDPTDTRNPNYYN